MTDTYDVVVAGAGPAGSLAALLLARAGMSVLLAEKSAWPRDKVCGGCLNARGVDLLQSESLDLPSLKNQQSYDSMRLVGFGSVVDLPLTQGRIIDRRVFDAELVDASIREGVHFLPEHRVALFDGDNRDDGLRIMLKAGANTRVVSTGYMIDATGVGQQTTPTSWVQDRRCLVGVSATVLRSDWPAEVPAPGQMVMAVRPEGYVGVVLLGDDRVHAAAAIRPSVIQRRRSGVAAVVADMLMASPTQADSDSLTRMIWKGTGLLNRHASPAASHRWFRVGDAAGYREPFTGEGITRALESARHLAQLLLSEKDTPAQEQIWNRWCFHRYQRQWPCRLVSDLIANPIAARVSLALLSRLPVLAQPILRSIQADVPRGVS